MAFRFLSDTNGYIPEANGIVVAHIRKESEYAINKYAQYVPTEKSVGTYVKIGRDESVRLKTPDLYAWKDGDDMPAANQAKLIFTEEPFRTQRFAMPWTLGYQAQKQTTLFKPKLVHMNTEVSRMMVLRTYKAIAALETSSNWPTGHVNSANTLNGGRGGWLTGTADPSDPTGLAIYRSLMAMYLRIHLDTNGVVKMSDVRVIIDPLTAQDIAESAELVNYVRESSDSVKIIKEGFEAPSPANNWGLPTKNGKPVYRGFEFAVEDAVRVSEAVHEDSTAAGVIEAVDPYRAYMKDKNTAVMVTRQGALDGTYGTKNYSTFQIYHHEGLMRVKAEDDTWNEKIKGAVVEEIFSVIAAPYTGGLITGIRA
jgi:hypothetical protein